MQLNNIFSLQNIKMLIKFEISVSINPKIHLDMKIFRHNLYDKKLTH